MLPQQGCLRDANFQSPIPARCRVIASSKVMEVPAVGDTSAAERECRLAWLARLSVLERYGV
jgi:hypothetical protein